MTASARQHMGLQHNVSPHVNFLSQAVYWSYGLTLTHQEPEQSTKGDIEDRLYTSYLGNDVYRIELRGAIKHDRAIIGRSCVESVPNPLKLNIQSVDAGREARWTPSCCKAGACRNKVAPVNSVIRCNSLCANSDTSMGGLICQLCHLTVLTKDEHL